MTELLDTAFRYIKRGFSIIPLRPNDKRPAVPWVKYQTERASKRQVRAWFGGYPAPNIGIVTGAISGLIVLDIDPGGEESLEGVALPSTYEVQTPRGRHVYFRWPGSPTPNKVALYPGVDLRGDGGYVVAPPSVINGEAYRAYGQLRHMFAELPPDLLALARASRSPKVVIHPPTLVPLYEEPLDAKYVLGTPYGFKALEGTRKKLLASSKGERNLELFKAACRMGELVAGGELWRAAVVDVLRRTALEIGLDPFEITATINSGLSRGVQRPRSASNRGSVSDPKPRTASSGTPAPREAPGSFESGFAEGHFE